MIVLSYKENGKNVRHNPLKHYVMRVTYFCSSKIYRLDLNNYLSLKFLQIY